MANYISKRGANVAPSYATTDDLPASTEVGDLVFVDGQLGIAVSASGYQTCDKTDIVFPFDWTATTQQAKLTSADVAAGDMNGQNVSISGTTIAVGGGGNDEPGSDSGAAYVFTRSGTSWSQQAKLVASDAEANDYFGHTIAIDGDTIVVGARGEDTGGSYSGAAYVFTRSGTSWSQQAKLQASDKAANDEFGWNVAIDGDTIVVGALYEDAAASNAGAAYVFTRSGTTWSQQAKIVSSDIQANDYFGNDVGISGDTVVVTAFAEDTGGSLAGAAYVFTRSGTSWSQQAKLQASDKAEGDEFGISVGISGDSVIVGAHKQHGGEGFEGAAYIFARSGTSWSQQAKLVASDKQTGDYFGVSVDIDTDNVIVGAHQEDTTASDAGAAYVFTRSGTSWTQAKKLQASDAEATDKFAYRVGIDGGYAVAGTYLEDTGGTSAGSAYAFIAG